MKIKFTQSGGFAGLLRTCFLDTEQMSAEEATTLGRLFRESRLSDMSHATAEQGRDTFSYRLEVEEDGKTNVWDVDELSLPETAHLLIEFLQEHCSPTKK